MEITWEGIGAEEKGIDKHGNVIVAVDPRYYRPTEVETLLGDASKARRELGWQPTVTFQRTRERDGRRRSEDRREGRTGKKARLLGLQLTTRIKVRSGKMEKNSRIYVAGHRGLVGSAICRALERQGYENLHSAHPRGTRFDRPRRCAEFFEQEQPEFVFLAAAKVGGILANDTYPADFIRENLEIQTSVIDASYRSGVKRLLFLGSSCIYPKLAPQPIKEEYLLTGPLEPTNRAYASGQDRRNRNVLVLQPPVRHQVSWPRCQPICMDLATISICRVRMSCLP